MSEKQVTKQEPGKPPATPHDQRNDEQHIGTGTGDRDRTTAFRQEQKDQASHRLDGGQLSVLLHRAGIIDMEVGLLLAKEITDKRGDEKVTAGMVVEQIRRQRPWLFQDGAENLAPGLPGPTAGLHGRSGYDTNRLEALAQQARKSQSRRDIQQYLRLRRAMQ